MLDLLTDFNAWAALASLTALEIVLGVDNVVFISILVGHLDPAPKSPGASASGSRSCFASRCCSH